MEETLLQDIEKRYTTTSNSGKTRGYEWSSTEDTWGDPTPSELIRVEGILREISPDEALRVRRYNKINVCAVMDPAISVTGAAIMLFSNEYNPENDHVTSYRQQVPAWPRGTFMFARICGDNIMDLARVGAALVKTIKQMPPQQLIERVEI